MEEEIIIHKNTQFRIKRKVKDSDDLYIIEAHIGHTFDLGVTITFATLKIEWEKDFDLVVRRAKDMLKEYTQDYDNI
jgi:hypothetical protein